MSGSGMSWLPGIAAPERPVRLGTPCLYLTRAEQVVDGADLATRFVRHCKRVTVTNLQKEHGDVAKLSTPTQQWTKRISVV
jgi:hypothetical protein